MATYEEIKTIIEGSETLKTKISVAIADKSQALLNLTTPTQSQIDWAKDNIFPTESTFKKVLWSVVIQNKSASVSAIQNASDALVQTNVNAAIDGFLKVGV